jgi:hypothetical protein
LFFVVVAMFVLIRNKNLINLINVFIVAFLTYFVILKKSLIMFFKAFICLRNLFCLYLFKILFFLLYIRTYIVYSLKVRHYQRNLSIFLIIFVHFVIYLSLILLYNLVYEIKSLIVFFKASNNFVVYLLLSSFFIELFNINSNNKFLNMLSNFFKFITFQFRLNRR